MERLAWMLAPLDLEPRARVAEQQKSLSSLWIFASLEYLYCDVIGLMDPTMHAGYESGHIGGMTLDENFLLAGTILMQVPLSMVFLSTMLAPRASRLANMVAAAFMTVVQSATLVIGEPRSYYVASSVAEIATTSFIAVYALLFMRPNVAPAMSRDDEERE